jgi:hypothetical protein
MISWTSSSHAANVLACLPAFLPSCLFACLLGANLVYQGKLFVARGVGSLAPKPVPVRTTISYHSGQRLCVYSVKSWADHFYIAMIQIGRMRL